MAEEDRYDLPIRRSYNAEAATVIDEAWKVRRSLIDGLGRMVRIDEPVRDFTSQELQNMMNDPNQILGTANQVLGTVSSPY